MRERPDARSAHGRARAAPAPQDAAGNMVNFLQQWPVRTLACSCRAQRSVRVSAETLLTRVTVRAGAGDPARARLDGGAYMRLEQRVQRGGYVGGRRRR